MIRIIIYLLLLFGFLSYGGWWAWNYNPAVENFIGKYLQQGQFQTLETRYHIDTILQKNFQKTLKDNQHKLQSPTVHFYPYLLLDVKYSNNHQTGEGLILWGMEDGEMVLNTANWERTHGFKDCIQADTTKEEFKIINTIAKEGGHCDREKLLSLLRMEEENVDNLLNSCRKKKLIVQGGNDYRLHFEKPILNVLPETIIDQPLVTKACSDPSAKIPKNYSSHQIKRIAEAAFGYDFAIRLDREVFLPVYKIAIENPDGSIWTTYWNALNGKQIDAISNRYKTSHNRAE